MNTFAIIMCVLSILFSLAAIITIEKPFVSIFMSITAAVIICSVSMAALL